MSYLFLTFTLDLISDLLARLKLLIWCPQVEMDDQDWMPDAHGHIPPPKPRQPLNLPFALPRAKGGTVVRKAGRPSRAEAILRAKKEAEKNNGEFV